MPKHKSILYRGYIYKKCCCSHTSDLSMGCQKASVLLPPFPIGWQAGSLVCCIAVANNFPAKGKRDRAAINRSRCRHRGWSVPKCAPMPCPRIATPHPTVDDDNNAYFNGQHFHYHLYSCKPNTILSKILCSIRRSHIQHTK